MYVEGVVDYLLKKEEEECVRFKAKLTGVSIQNSELSKPVDVIMEL